MERTLILSLVGVLGLLLGSFANVLILRDGPARATIATGRSACPHCGKVLRWWELIPVLSFLGLRGMCARCKMPISWQYPIVELAMAALAVAAYIHYPSTLAAGLLLLSFLFGLVCVVQDLRTRTISLEWALFQAGFGLAAALVQAPHNWLNIVLGGLIGFAALFIIRVGWKLITGKDGMGEGDQWLALGVGWTVGWPYVLPALLLAVYAGAIAGVGALLVGRKDRALPFGPFLFLGMLLMILVGDGIFGFLADILGL